MPPTKDAGPLGEAEAAALVADHEKRHGRDMSDKIPKGSRLGSHDVPSTAELDAEPEWHKHGHKIDDQPDGADDGT